MSDGKTRVSLLRYNNLIAVACEAALSRDHRRRDSGRGGNCGVCRRCDCRHPDLSPATISLLNSSQDTDDDTHTVIVSSLELGGAVGAVWPKDPVPVVQFACGYVVVLGEDETVVASLGFGKLGTIRSNFTLSGVQEILTGRRWFATSA